MNKGQIMITPTLGLPIWYHPASAEGLQTDQSGFCTGRIIAVNSATNVNLEVISADGKRSEARLGVFFSQQGQPQGGAYCRATEQSELMQRLEESLLAGTTR